MAAAPVTPSSSSKLALLTTLEHHPVATNGLVDEAGRNRQHRRPQFGAWDHISHSANDLSATIEFYSKLMGMTRTPRPPLDCEGAWFLHMTAGFQLHFLGWPAPSKARKIVWDERDGERGDLNDRLCVDMDHIALYVHDLQQAKRVLEKSKIEFREYTTDDMEIETHKLARIVFHDPDYNVIVLLPCRLDISTPFLSEPNLSSDATISIDHFAYKGMGTHDLDETTRFYTDFLSFMPTEPRSTHPRIVRLTHAVGQEIRIIKAATKHKAVNDITREISAPEDHTSWNVVDTDLPALDLKNYNVKYLASCLPGANVGQLFFHDPAGHMLEFCTCSSAIAPYAPPSGYKQIKVEMDARVSQQHQCGVVA